MRDGNWSWILVESGLILSICPLSGSYSAPSILLSFRPPAPQRGPVCGFEWAVSLVQVTSMIDGASSNRNRLPRLVIFQTTLMSLMRAFLSITEMLMDIPSDCSGCVAVVALAFVAFSRCTCTHLISFSRKFGKSDTRGIYQAKLYPAPRRKRSPYPYLEFSISVSANVSRCPTHCKREHGE